MTGDAIWRCGGKGLLAFECQETWDSLDLTDVPLIRFCSVCKMKVYQCQSPEEFVAFARKNECVAIPISLHVPEGTQTSQMMLGWPAPWSYKLERKAKAWWKKVEKLGGDLGRQFHSEMRIVSARRKVEKK